MSERNEQQQIIQLLQEIAVNKANITQAVAATQYFRISVQSIKRGLIKPEDVFTEERIDHMRHTINSAFGTSLQLNVSDLDSLTDELMHFEKIWKSVSLKNDDLKKKLTILVENQTLSADFINEYGEAVKLALE